MTSKQTWYSKPQFVLHGHMTKYKEMEEPGKLTLMTILVHKQNKMGYNTKANTPLMLRASFLNKML